MLQLPHSTQRFLSIAAAVGPTFDVKVISWFLEPSEESGSDIQDEHSSNIVTPKTRHAWVAGLQGALSESMVVNVSSPTSFNVALLISGNFQRGGDIYEFSHDRYREASLVLAESAPGGVEGILAKLVDMLLEGEQSMSSKYKICDYVLRCIPILQRKLQSQRAIYVQTLAAVGADAFSRGAPEVNLYCDFLH